MARKTKHMNGRVERRLRDQRGVVVVLVAMLMTVFLGMAALAIDIGSFEQAQTEVQATADAAALAGAQDLPGSATNAKAHATTYGTTNAANMTSLVVTPTSPYNSSASQIQVTVSASTPSFFGKIFGITSTSVSATAVAQATNTTSAAPGWFALGATCGPSEGDGIYVNASRVTMTGGIATNGSITMAGTGDSYGPSTYGGPPNNCQFYPQSGATANTFGTPTTYSPTANTTAISAYPNTFPGFPASSACTYGPPPLTTPAVVLSANPGTGNPTLNLQNLANAALPAGTYCYPEIDFNSDNMTGNVTFQAATFQLNHTETKFTPFYQGLLIYYTGSGQLTVDGTGNSYLTGGIYAPNGSVNMNTPSGTVNSFVEAQSIIVSGGNPLTWNSTLTTSSGSSGKATLIQ